MRKPGDLGVIEPKRNALSFTSDTKAAAVSLFQNHLPHYFISKQPNFPTSGSSAFSVFTVMK